MEFNNLQLETLAPATKTIRYSTLETVPFPTGDRRAIYAAPGTLRGPAYSPDAASLVVSHEGKTQRVPIAAGKSVEEPGLGNIPKPCAGFQGYSPDGKRLALTCGTMSSVYVSEAGVAKRITHKIPTMWHNWSPDSQLLLYSIDRKGRHDIAHIPAKGRGKEVRLTSDGLSDNPEFSADGKSIYFNSSRSGTMQVWRMPASGGKAEQVTSDEFNNWYPHVSPDGKRILVLSCDKSVSGPPEDRAVQLRAFTLETGRFQVVARLLTGGRGSLDSPPWSPDGKRIAFVTYQFLPEK